MRFAIRFQNGPFGILRKSTRVEGRSAGCTSGDKAAVGPGDSNEASVIHRNFVAQRLGLCLRRSRHHHWCRIYSGVTGCPPTVLERPANLGKRKTANLP
jgi:hypothetical protein